MTLTAHRHVAAWVDDEAVDEAQVDATVERLRSGPRAALLPLADTAEGRQLRRWVTQTLVTTRLLEQEAAALGSLTVPPLADISADRMAALQLGSVLASVLAESASARAVFAHITSGCRVSAEQIADYAQRNADQFGDARGGVRPLVEVTAPITTLLLAAARRRHFIDWLSRRSVESIRLEPGYEHPGDPRQPDATHRH